MSMRAELRDGVHVADLMPGHTGDRTFRLLPGLGGTLRFWSGVAPALSAAGRTLAIDVPGFGRSVLPGGMVTLDRVAGAIIEFCRRAKATRCTVVAHSLSGLIALRVAAKNPGARGEGAGARRPVRRRAGAAAAWPAGMIDRSKVLRSIALALFVAEPSRLDPVLTAEALSYTGGARTVLRALRQARGIDLPALLDAARVPVDVVRGDRDTMNTAADFAIVRRHADVRREQTIRNCRHWPLIEDPRALVDFILAKD